MQTTTIPHPPITDAATWRKARVELLAHEKALTRQRDKVNAERRRLPMVRLDKSYSFEGPDGPVTLLELFGGKRQLIVYHFMFDPDWEKGCPGCSSLMSAIGNISLLAKLDTAFTLVSRAPLAKLLAYREAKGWHLPWVSSFGSDFNYDFHVTHDESKAPIEYNYADKAAMEARRGVGQVVGEDHGYSVFFQMDGVVYHTYSVYARGCESVCDSYSLLDLTPYGRQESFEDSPEGWPSTPTYG